MNYRIIFTQIMGEEIEDLEMPLTIFKSTMALLSTNTRLFASNVIQLKVLCITLGDMETLSMRDGLGQIVFPKLETIIVDPPLPRRRKGGNPGTKPQYSSAQWEDMTAGVVQALKLRRDQGFPIQEIVLGPRAQSAGLLEDLSRSLPDVRVKLESGEAT